MGGNEREAAGEGKQPGRLAMLLHWVREVRPHVPFAIAGRRFADRKIRLAAAAVGAVAMVAIAAGGVLLATAMPEADSTASVSLTTATSASAQPMPTATWIPMTPWSTPWSAPSPTLPDWIFPPTMPPNWEVFAVQQKFPCQAPSRNPNPPVFSGSLVYANCVVGSIDSEPKTVAFDLSSGQVKQTYDTGYSGRVWIDGGLWYSYEPLCIMSCPAYTSYVYARDLTSGELRFTLRDARIVADGLGFIWALSTGSAKTVYKIDPKTDVVSQIPWSYGSTLTVACGSLWGLDKGQGNGITEGNLTTKFSRVDPHTGAELSEFVLLDWFDPPQETPEGCWTAGGRAFVGIGDNGPVAVTPRFQADDTEILDGTYWLSITGAEGYSGIWQGLQRLDPATWKTVGPVWTWDYLYDTTAVAWSGSIWFADWRDSDHKGYLVKSGITIPVWPASPPPPVPSLSPASSPSTSSPPSVAS